MILSNFFRSWRFAISILLIVFIFSFIGCASPNRVKDQEHPITYTVNGEYIGNLD